MIFKIQSLKKKDEITYLGSARVDGIECDIVTIKCPDNPVVKDWTYIYYIGKEDGIIRKLEKSMIVEIGMIKWVTIIKNLKINTKLDDKLFSYEPKNGIEIENYKRVTKELLPSLLKIGEQAPDWKLKDPSGKEVTLKDLRGKIVLLDFWGTWCYPCVKALLKIQAIYDKFTNNGVEVIGISCNEPSKAEPAQFIKNKNITYRLLLNGDDVANKYHLSSFPTIYIIGKDGKILYTYEGYSDSLEINLGKIIEENL